MQLKESALALTAKKNRLCALITNKDGGYYSPNNKHVRRLTIIT
jgi:hypothetical protein